MPAAHTQRSVCIAVAVVNDLDPTVLRTVNGEADARPDVTAGAFRVGDKAACVDVERMTQFVELDTVEIAHAGIADMADRLPGIGHRPARPTGAAEEDLIYEPANAACTAFATRSAILVVAAEQLEG